MTHYTSAQNILADLKVGDNLHIRVSQSFGGSWCFATPVTRITPSDQIITEGPDKDHLGQPCKRRWSPTGTLYGSGAGDHSRWTTIITKADYDAGIEKRRNEKEAAVAAIDAEAVNFCHDLHNEPATNIRQAFKRLEKAWALNQANL
jgi:hypothetical protein